MKLLFNLEAVEGNRIHARPVEYSQSLSLPNSVQRL